MPATRRSPKQQSQCHSNLKKMWARRRASDKENERIPPLELQHVRQDQPTRTDVKTVKRDLHNALRREGRLRQKNQRLDKEVEDSQIRHTVGAANCGVTHSRTRGPGCKAPDNAPKPWHRSSLRTGSVKWKLKPARWSQLHSSQQHTIRPAVLLHATQEHAATRVRVAEHRAAEEVRIAHEHAAQTIHEARRHAQESMRMAQEQAAQQVHSAEDKAARLVEEQRLDIERRAAALVEAAHADANAGILIAEAKAEAIANERLRVAENQASDLLQVALLQSARAIRAVETEAAARIAATRRDADEDVRAAEEKATARVRAAEEERGLAEEAGRCLEEQLLDALEHARDDLETVKTIAASKELVATELQAQLTSRLQDAMHYSERLRERIQVLEHQKDALRKKAERSPMQRERAVAKARTTAAWCATSLLWASRSVR
ncbi:hypothetical protein PYCCODRAFT_1433794 [Trametes coccinea BRFM310]|uniref:Uncharacterized protein n=1 Tax=Trametes coccinea (strain BRFM310) TaxID=1353009 RepID=A0A1Y2ITD5_TRAC3|nr:hypothetical protein PYCCODRAFT_1433794 [Trametes coccinea BRFM310]